jgi:hypothetical protein
MKQFRPGQSHDFLGLCGDHQRRMQKETVSPAVAGGPQSLDPAIPDEIDFGRVADQQPRPRGLRPRRPPMWFAQRAKRHIVPVEQSVGSLAVGPTFGLVRRAAVGMRGYRGGQSDRSFSAPLVAQITFSKLLLSPFVDIQFESCHALTSVPDSKNACRLCTSIRPHPRSLAGPGSSCNCDAKRYLRFNSCHSNQLKPNTATTNSPQCEINVGNDKSFRTGLKPGLLLTHAPAINDGANTAIAGKPGKPESLNGEFD